MNIQKFFKCASLFAAPLALVMNLKPMPAFSQPLPFWYFTTTDTTVTAQMPLGTTVCNRQGDGGIQFFNAVGIVAWHTTDNTQGKQFMITDNAGSTIVIDNNVPNTNSHAFAVFADNEKKEIINKNFREKMITLANGLAMNCQLLFESKQIYSIQQEKPQRPKTRVLEIYLEMLDRV